MIGGGPPLPSGLRAIGETLASLSLARTKNLPIQYAARKSPPGLRRSAAPPLTMRGSLRHSKLLGVRSRFGSESSAASPPPRAGTSSRVMVVVPSIPRQLPAETSAASQFSTAGFQYGGTGHSASEAAALFACASSVAPERKPA